MPKNEENHALDKMRATTPDFEDDYASNLEDKYCLKNTEPGCNAKSITVSLRRRAVFVLAAEAL